MKTIIEMTRELGGFAPTTKFLERFAALVAAAEREAIYDQWHSCVMADLENGVKWLNEKAAAEWHANYPAQSNLFPAWIESREHMTIEIAAGNEAFYGFPHGSVSALNASGKCVTAGETAPKEST